MIAENENTVLEQAIEALKKETGVRLHIIELDRKVTDNEKAFRFDAVVGVEGYEPLQFAAEVKRHAQHINFGAIINQLERLPMKGLLVADYINPDMAEKLHKEKIQFIDTVGNAYINAEPLFIYVKGNKNKDKETRNKEEKGIYPNRIIGLSDLIATGDARNIETARMIKDEHIRPVWKD